MLFIADILNGLEILHKEVKMIFLPLPTPNPSLQEQNKEFRVLIRGTPWKSVVNKDNIVLLRSYFELKIFFNILY